MPHHLAAAGRPMRTAISSLPRKLGADAEDPAYIVTELRLGWRTPKGRRIHIRRRSRERNGSHPGINADLHAGPQGTQTSGPDNFCLG